MLMTKQTSRRELLRIAGAGAVGMSGAMSGCLGIFGSGGDEVWHFDVDLEGSALNVSPFTAPAVAEETVYVGHIDGNLYALEKETGEELWRFESIGEWGPAEIRAAPVLLDGTIYVGSYDTYLYAIDAETGEEEWRVSVGGSIEPSPHVTENVLYVAGFDTVHAIRTTGGRKTWQLETPDIIYSAPLLKDGTLYIASDNGYVRALNPESADELWRTSLGIGDLRSSPTVVDNRLFIGSEEFLYALNTETGEELWDIKDESTVQAGGDSYETITDDIESAPTVFDGTVYFNALGTNAVDAESGRSIWTYDPTISPHKGSSPTATNDTVFAGSVEYLHAIDIEDGDERWRFETRGSGSGRSPSSPVVVDGVAYFGGTDSKFYAIDTGSDESSKDSRVAQRVSGHI